LTINTAIAETATLERSVGAVIDYQNECLLPLQAADANNDSILDRNEFISFMQSLSNDQQIQDLTFVTLSITLVQEYTGWVCAGYCNSFNLQNCIGGECQDGIPLTGPPGSSETNLRPYLYTVCVKAMEEVARIVGPNDDVVTEEYQVNVPFGVANVLDLDAQGIANDTGVLNGIIGVWLNQLQLQVQNNMDVEPINGINRLLDVTAMGSYVDMIDDQPCPSSINFSSDVTPLCQHLNGIFKIRVTSDTNPDTAITQVVNQALALIRGEDFDIYLPNDKSQKFFFYSLQEDEEGNSSPLPLFAYLSLASGAALLGIFAVKKLIFRNKVRRGSHVLGEDFIDESDEEMQTSNPYGGKLGGHNVEAMQVEKGASVVTGAYSEVSRDESESDVGSSGWSSSAGMSSLNTGASVDSSEFFGSSLAAIGAASNVHKKFVDGANKDNIYPIKSVDENSQSDGSDEPKMDSDFGMSPGHQQRQMISRNDLEKQIEDGDWAGVGATAAVLASDSRSTEGSVTSAFGSDFSASSSGLSSALSGTSRDRARAAELDRLVDGGDWDGVVLAAAKFEAESDRDDRTDGSVSGKSSYKSAADRSFTNLSVNSPKGSVSTNMSDVKRAEKRAEVVSLVHRVVPEEIDNVDEMMLQFQGREEELVETLRTMQERSIAARQREASRRNAKREAKKLAKEAKKANNSLSGLPPKSTPPRIDHAKRGAKQLAKDARKASNSKSSLPKAGPTKSETEKLVNDTDLMSVPSKGDSNVSDNTPQRLALDEAIAAGDWEAVGRTAEHLGEASDSSASVNTSDFESAGSANELDSSAYLSTTSMPDTERAAELEELIEEKDWSGVAAAASRFSSADAAKVNVSHDDQKSKSSGSSSSSWKRSFLFGKGKSNSDDATDDTSRDKNIKKEEEEARAQAEIWSTIAEQSKGKGSNAIGASDAADWAISRSLKQIQDSSPGNNQVETQSVDSSNDDKSV